MQAAPRDALISDLAPDGSRSACFGFAQSMRKWGSAVGAVMVYFLMKVSDRYRTRMQGWTYLSQVLKSSADACAVLTSAPGPLAVTLLRLFSCNPCRHRATTTR